MNAKINFAVNMLSSRIVSNEQKIALILTNLKCIGYFCI